MEHSEYLELNRKFSDFYIKEISPALAFLNKRRRQKSILLFLYIALLISFSLFFLAIVIPKLFLFFILVVIILVFLINISLKKFGIVNLSSDLDADFKRRFMDDFVKLFGNLHWKKVKFYDDEVGSLSNDRPKQGVKESFNPIFYKNVEKVKALDLFNFATLSIDDFISGIYKNVQFSIIEVKTVSKLSVLFTNAFMATLLFFPVVFFLILYILVVGFIGIVVVISFYHLTIWAFVNFGLSKPLSAILSATLFVLVIKFILQLIVDKLIFPLVGKFRGVIVEFAMNKNFEGQTIILDNSNDGRKVFIDKKKYCKVELEDVEFMKNYTVYSTSQIEARYLITTAFIDRLKNIKTKFKTKYIRVAFKDNKIVIALHTDRDMFKMADMTADSGKQTFMALFEEIVSVLDFINQLKLNKKLGL